MNEVTQTDPSTAVAYAQHLEALAQAGQAIKPAAEVIRATLVAAGQGEGLERIQSTANITRVVLRSGANRALVATLLMPLWGGPEQGNNPRVQQGIDAVIIRKAGWEDTRPVTVEYARPLAYGMTEAMLFDAAEVVDATLATKPAGTLWDIRELIAGLPRKGIPVSAAVLDWMCESGYVVKIPLRGRTLFKRQHMAA